MARRCIRVSCARTTIDIDDDVLLAARRLARRGRTSIGAVISDLARKGLQGGLYRDSAQKQDSLYGFRPLAKRGRPVTNELIDRLREEGPY